MDWLWFAGGLVMVALAVANFLWFWRHTVRFAERRWWNVPGQTKKSLRMDPYHRRPAVPGSALSPMHFTARWSLSFLVGSLGAVFVSQPFR